MWTRWSPVREDHRSRCHADYTHSTFLTTYLPSGFIRHSISCPCGSQKRPIRQHWRSTRMGAGSGKVGEWEGYRFGKPEAAQRASGPRARRLTQRLRQQQQQHSGPLSQLMEIALPLLWAALCDDGARAFRLVTMPARGRRTLTPDGHCEAGAPARSQSMEMAARLVGAAYIGSVGRRTPLEHES